MAGTLHQAARALAAGADLGDVPLLGRDTALATLDDVLRALHKNATAQLVCLTAAEGQGKSRLLDVVQAVCLEDPAGPLVLRISGRDRAKNLRGAIEAILDERLYVPRDATNAERATRLADGVRTLLPAARQQPVLEGLRGLLLPPDSPDASGAGPGDADFDVEANALAAFAELLAADASESPIVLLIDDAHAAHPRVLDLVALLHRSLSDARLLLLVAGEPALAQAMPKTEQARTTTIALSPLSDETVATLVRHMLAPADEVPARLLERVSEHALGNPMAAMGIVRILMAAGVVDTSEAPWRIELERLDEVVFPTDFEDVVRQRLDTLDVADRQLLTEAALVGSVFETGALLAIQRDTLPTTSSLTALWSARTEVAALLARLDALSARDLIHPSGTHDVPHEQVWRFKHAVEQRLLASAADQALAQRAAARTAQWLLAQPGNRAPGFAARVAVSLERAGQPTRAAQAWLDAADEARLRHATVEAIRLLRRALDQIGDAHPDLRIEALHRLGTLLDLRGAHDQAIPVFEELGRLAWAVASRSKGGLAFHKLGRCHRSLGDYAQARACLEQALALFSHVDDLPGVAAARDELGRVWRQQGDLVQAQAAFEEALAMRRRLGEPRSIALSLTSSGAVLLEQGHMREALAAFREALQLRREAGDTQGIAESLNAIGVLMMERGDLHAAVSLWTEALATAREIDDRTTQAMLLDNLGEASLQIGDLQAAESWLVEAVRIAEDSGNRRIAGDAIRNLGLLEARRGNRQMALAHVEDALEIARELGSRSDEGIALRDLAELQAAQVFDPDGGIAAASAEAYFHEAIRLLEDVGAVAEVARARQGLGTYFVERGDVMLGRQQLLRAREQFLQLEMKRGVAQTDDLLQTVGGRG